MANVKAYTRRLKNGRTINVRAHTRKGGVATPYIKNPHSTIMQGAELKDYMDKRNDYHFLGQNKMDYAKKNGSVVGSGGNVFYYDNAKKDYYVTPGIASVSHNYGKFKSIKDADGAHRVYLKNNTRDAINNLLA